MLEGRGYFAKIHEGVGWGEIFKNLISLRLPVISAMNELNAIAHLEEAGVATMHAVAGARHGWNPAHVKSCVVTRELTDTVSLEELAEAGGTSVHNKRRLIASVAGMARKMHRSGMNHRDFYICHFLVKRADLEAGVDDPRVYLIDLHRAQLRSSVPRRWLVKDLAGLLFSSLDTGMTRRDYLRFLRLYSGQSLREVLKDEAGFWADVIKRALRLYHAEHGRAPRFVPVAA